MELVQPLRESGHFPNTFQQAALSSVFIEPNLPNPKEGPNKLCIALDRALSGSYGAAGLVGELWQTFKGLNLSVCGPPVPK